MGSCGRRKADYAGGAEGGGAEPALGPVRDVEGWWVVEVELSGAGPPPFGVGSNVDQARPLACSLIALGDRPCESCAPSLLAV